MLHAVLRSAPAQLPLSPWTKKHTWFLPLQLTLGHSYRVLLSPAWKIVPLTFPLLPPALNLVVSPT